MIRHCSLFKFKAGTSDQFIDEVVANYRALAELVPEVRSLVVGRNIGYHADNYDIAANVEFDSIDGYRAYVANESHTTFSATYLRSHVDSRVAVQITLE